MLHFENIIINRKKKILISVPLNLAKAPLQESCYGNSNEQWFISSIVSTEGSGERLRLMSPHFHSWSILVPLPSVNSLKRMPNAVSYDDKCLHKKAQKGEGEVESFITHLNRAVEKLSWVGRIEHFPLLCSSTLI